MEIAKERPKKDPNLRERKKDNRRRGKKTYDQIPTGKRVGGKLQRLSPYAREEWDTKKHYRPNTAGFKKKKRLEKRRTVVR